MPLEVSAFTRIMVKSDISTELCMWWGGGTAADLEPILRSFLYQNGLKSNVSPRLMCPRAKAWVSASSSCDNPPSVCGPGSGHTSQRRIVQGKIHPREALSKGGIVQGKHCPRTFIRGHIGRGHIVTAFVKSCQLL